MVIVLCGGGSAGHVLPNLGLIEFLEQKFHSHSLAYIIEKNGVELDLLKHLPDLAKHSIYAGKIRRYLSFQNLLDLLKVPVGIVQALRIFLHIRPELVISKGGYVCVPVIIAAFILRIPIIHHESDASPSLTSKLASVLATELWYQYTSSQIGENSYAIQLPLRKSITVARKQDFTFHKYLDSKKPTLLVMGGSLGAKFLNDFVANNLDSLIQHYNIIHLTGLKQPEVKKPKPNYVPLKFVNNLGDIYKNTDFFIGRAGANTLSELAYFQIKSILVPLPLTASRGEQMQNAKAFVKAHSGEIIMQDSIEIAKVLKSLQRLQSLDQDPGSESNNYNTNQLLFSRLSHYLTNDH